MTTDRAAQKRAYYLANKEKQLAAQKARYVADPEKFRAAQKARYANNREAVKSYQKEWRKKNPEKAAAIRDSWRARNKEKYAAACRALSLRKNYGLTLKEFQAMWDVQSGLCLNKACSRSLEVRVGGYAVDHDHATGAIRGILCMQCNRALGYAHDSVEVLQGLINYLGQEKKRG